MRRPRPTVAAAAFALKFCAFACVVVPLWWLVIPAYGWIVAQGCGAFLKYAAGMPIDSARIETQGMLNTGSDLIFLLEDREARMEFAALVTNLPPFLALVGATPGLSRARRIRTALLGAGVLIGSHIAFILVMLPFGAQLRAVPEISTSLAQFLLTLPFLLWIVLAYWDRPVLRRPSGGHGPP